MNCAWAPRKTTGLAAAPAAFHWLGGGAPGRRAAAAAGGVAFQIPLLGAHCRWPWYCAWYPWRRVGLGLGLGSGSGLGLGSGLGFGLGLGLRLGLGLGLGSVLPGAPRPPSSVGQAARRGPWREPRARSAWGDGPASRSRFSLAGSSPPAASPRMATGAGAAEEGRAPAAAAVRGGTRPVARAWSSVGVGGRPSL
eukprot:scaffold34439_cov67-Phaeocystis_antarctica.AAC.1